MPEDELNQALEQARRAFTLACELGQSFSELAKLRVVNYDASVWRTQAPFFERFWESLLEVRGLMQAPPRGLESVSDQLLKAARIAKRIRHAMQQSSETTEWAGGPMAAAFGIADSGRPQFTAYSEFFSDLLSVGSEGLDAIRSVWSANPPEEPFAFVDDENPNELTLLDRFPATPEGHIKFLEWVYIEVREQASALRDGKYPHESIENQLRSGIKWTEARRRLADLCDLPPDLSQQASSVLNRDLAIGSIELIERQMRPVVQSLRDFQDQNRDSRSPRHTKLSHLTALQAVKAELELWNSLNSPSESGYEVEHVQDGHALQSAIATLQFFYGGSLPREAAGHWRKFLRFARDDNEEAEGERDWLANWVKEEIKVRDIANSTVVVATAGDLWKAFTEGRTPAVTVSAISLGPPFGVNIAQPRFPKPEDQAKWDQIEQTIALCDAEGGDRTEAMRKLIARVALSMNVDRREIINMPIAQFADIARRLVARSRLDQRTPDPVESLLDQLMSQPACDMDITAEFRNERHDALLEKLQRLLGAVTPALTQIAILQSLQDRGCDLVITSAHACKYGVQLKSNGDVKNSDFANKTLAQIQDSRQHGLAKLYLLIAADITGNSNQQRVRGLVSRISAMNDTYVHVVPPERVWTLVFRTPPALRSP
jgi:hypothetical protein